MTPQLDSPAALSQSPRLREVLTALLECLATAPPQAANPTPIGGPEGSGPAGAQQEPPVAEAVVSGPPVPSDWREVQLTDVPRVPGMTQPDELRYYYWCCATQHQAGRSAVELGSWVGCSTMAMAAGLRRSTDKSAKLHTVDKFRWDSWSLGNVKQWTLGYLNESQKARLTERDLNPHEDDSFLPIFRAYTEPLKDWLEVNEADLDTFHWAGGPIDVLMIDAAKSWPTWDKVLCEFFPHLVDNAVVIQQDYSYYFCYWLHIVSERMIERGVLSVAENVAGTPTQGFRFHANDGFCVDDYLQRTFTDEEAARLMLRSTRRFDGPNERLAALSAYVRLLQDQGRPVQARAAFAGALRRGGYADNYALKDLIALGNGWTLNAAAPLFESLTGPHPVTLSSSRHGLWIDCPGGGVPLRIESRLPEAADWRELVMTFTSPQQTDGAVRARVRVTNMAGEAFFDDELVVQPGRFVPLCVPVAGREGVVMEWTFVCEGPMSPARRIQCVGPLLV